MSGLELNPDTEPAVGGSHARNDKPSRSAEGLADSVPDKGPADTSSRRGLWQEIAVALALITLMAIVLNAGVFWLWLQRTEEGRRSDFAIGISNALVAEIENLSGEDAVGSGVRKVLLRYSDTMPELNELYVLNAVTRTEVVAVGQPPSAQGPRSQTFDAGLRGALYGKEQYVTVVGPLWGARSIQVTTPIGPRGSPKGALRVSMSLSSASAPGGAIGYLLLYVGFSSVAIALFGLSLLRRQLFQPIDALQQGTARIAKGEFGIRLEIDAARELQELCAALNSMSQSLEDYRHKTGEQVERLRETNRALRETQEALVQSERLAGVGRLAAGLAHEVGNPLAAVLGFVDMLAEGSQTPEVDQGLIVRSQQELARIHGIIRQLLDYSHPQVESASNVGLTQLFAEAAASVRHLPELHGVDLELADVTGIEVLGLERELHQVVVNLIRNAADAVSGVERATIRLCAAMVGDCVDVVCEDNGPGFATEAKNQALEPFYTTKDVGKGTGLGLAFCFRTMERLGGAIFLEDSPLGGALVRLRFRGPN